MVAGQLPALVLAGTWGRTDAFQASVFTGLGHPWRTGHRDVALAALGIAFSPELLSSPEFPAMTEQLEPLFPSTPDQLATAAEQWDADMAHDALDRLDRFAAPTLVIAAEHDLLTPPGQGWAVADRIPRSPVRAAHRPRREPRRARTPRRDRRPPPRPDHDRPLRVGATMPITRTFVGRTPPGRYETIDVELDDPGQNEVTVKIAASGLCHSDDHVHLDDGRPVSARRRSSCPARTRRRCWRRSSGRR